MSDLERCIEESRQCRDLLLSGAKAKSHPEQRGLRLAIADQVAEEVLIRLEDERQDKAKEGMKCR
jgi:hypothetical protein